LRGRSALDTIDRGGRLLTETGDHGAALGEQDAGGDGHQEDDSPEDPTRALERRVDLGLEVRVEQALFGHIGSIGAVRRGLEADRADGGLVCFGVVA
jgi:hypothetical protein